MKKSVFLGGDERMIALSSLLEKSGHEVVRIAQEAGEITPDGLNDMMQGASVVWLGVPAMKEGIVYAPRFSGAITQSMLIDAVPKDSYIAGGLLDAAFCQKAEKRGCACIDYAIREDFAADNAWITAEAALAILVKETDTAIRGQQVCLYGYGRLGKALLKLLTGFGAQTVVATRRADQHIWIKADGGIPLSDEACRQCIHDFSIIINTAPVLTFTDRLLSHVREDCLILDLASRPGGVDFAAAKNRHIRTIWACGLPGKTAPVSAARVIRRSVMNALKERGDYERAL